MKLKLLLLTLVIVLILGACGAPDPADRPVYYRNNEQSGPFWNPLFVGSDYSAGVELPWHPINPPHPGLNCWAAEIEYHSGGYAGYGYSYVWCEPSSQ